jgi:hypothetical protein
VIDSLATDVRSLIEQVMGMPPNSVRPANQAFPAGGQTDKLVTVFLTSCDDLSIDTTYELVNPADPTQGTNEVTQVPKQFLCSVNFYRGTVAADPEGIAEYGASAMDQASRFIQLLQFSVNIDLMTSLGLAFVTSSKPRDLSALVDATWESRAQIDVTFMAINREAAVITTLESAEVDVSVQGPGGTVHTITAEVSL